jgi:hypothetical protein
VALLLARATAAKNSGVGKPPVTAVTKDPTTLLYTSPLKDSHPTRSSGPPATPRTRRSSATTPAQRLRQGGRRGPVPVQVPDTAFTSLLKRINSSAYYLPVKAIAVDGAQLQLPGDSLATGGVVFSTRVPYTTPRPDDVYWALVDAFHKQGLRVGGSATTRTGCRIRDLAR